MRRVQDFWIQLWRTVTWHRHLVAGGLAAAAVALTIHAVEPPAEPSVAVVTAARDLPGDTTIAAGDTLVRRIPADSVPAGSLPSSEDLTGRRLAGPVRAGEVLTDVRLVGTALLDGWGPELAAVPVRIADPGTARLATPGDIIDIVAADMSGTGGADVLAADVPVLSVPGDETGGPLADGALLVVAATPGQVRTLAGAAVTSRLSIALRGGR